MDHNLPHTISLLTRTPAALNAFLRDLPETWTSRNEGENTWSVFDIVGHLIHGERTDWMPRARISCNSARRRRLSLLIAGTRTRGSRQVARTVAGRIRSFAVRKPVRTAWTESAARGPRAAWAHPALGVATLSQLLATWAAHDLTHLHQISRVMAHQYREAVGPWSAYLGVCTAPATALLSANEAHTHDHTGDR